MNERTLRVLELDKVKTMLCKHVSSGLGRELAEGLLPVTERKEIGRLLDETAEARTVVRTEEFPLRGLTDVRPAVRRTAIGAVVNGEDLWLLAAVLAISRRAHRFFAGRNSLYPLLAAHAARLVPLRSLEDLILTAIGEDGEVLDRASTQLQRLRGDIRQAQREVKQKLEGMLRSSVVQKYLQEALVTVRGDRYVLPVKSEYRAQIPGIIHDQSASGATLFIEPMAVVELNNKLRQYQAAESQEVEHILRELSARIAAQSQVILKNLEILAWLDLSLAKGRLSYEMRAARPVLSHDNSLSFPQARHPLIPSADVRPIDVRLGQSFSVLLVTGPNTGGKTVTLKTIGLLTLMAQCGLHIPAAEGSQAGVYESVYADIGDEQSIEQSLSTFSSHMTNIIQIIDAADGTSLVLLDELGAGTDPMEGAALAMAIIDSFLARGTHVVATTHYSELKAYAHTKRGVQNASMEFDVETLRPTFHLTIGLPGKSNAFEISARLGLDKDVIDLARRYLTHEALKVEDLIRGLEASRKEADEASRQAFVKQRQAETQLKEAEQHAKLQQEKVREIQRRASEEAKALVRRAKHEIEALIEALKQAEKEGATQELTQTIELVRQRQREITREVSEQVEAEAVPAAIAPPEEPIAVGDDVLLLHLNQRGKVLEVLAGGSVTVQLGALRTQVEVKHLRKVSEGKKRESPERTGFHTVDFAAHNVKLELDLRGRTVEEGVQEVDKYLDSALLRGLGQVQIIHGKGTGALREGIRDFLNTHPAVKSHRLGLANEGGSGVTVVDLKQ
ncbi:MAG: Endonuclease MutS2 [Firmicutes bacterium]|nr:Endonuclease MutS2 [candidate division NPL-UPA2 bacterium]